MSQQRQQSETSFSLPPTISMRVKILFLPSPQQQQCKGCTPSSLTRSRLRRRRLKRALHRSSAAAEHAPPARARIRVPPPTRAARLLMARCLALPPVDCCLLLSSALTRWLRLARKLQPTLRHRAARLLPAACSAAGVKRRVDFSSIPHIYGKWSGGPPAS